MENLLPPEPPVNPAANAIEKVGYSHDKMIDLIIANPRVKQDDLAALMGYTPGWLSRVVNSDAFKLRMAQRRAELVDPLIISSLEQRFAALATRGLEVMQAKLDQHHDVVGFGDAAKAVELGARGLAVGGFGAKVAVDASLTVDLKLAIEEGNARRRELRQRTVEHEPPQASSAMNLASAALGFDLDTELTPC